MRRSLKEMRHNERILIAVDVLLHSKSSFMSVFLMAFMMKISLSDSPRDFIIYCLIRYALMGVLSILMIPFLKRHPLLAWRSSMVFSILEIATVILFSTWPGFIYITAIFSALESVLYWRPKMVFDAKEVSDQNRIKFKSTGQIFIEAAKIFMPILLGLAIDDGGYQNAAVFILIISTLQLIISIFFRPRSFRIKKRPVSSSVHRLFAHASLQKLLWLQLLRGLLTSSSAYIVTATIALNLAATNNTQRGIVTATASAIAIVALLLYRKFAKTARRQKIILISLVPAVILVPVITFMYPDDVIVSFIFYIFTTAVVASLLDSTVSVVRIQNILSRHAKDDDDRVVAEAIGETALSIGRAISLSILLLIVSISDFRHELLLVASLAFLILPFIAMTVSSRALARGK